MRIWLIFLGLISANCYGQFSYVYKKYSSDKSHYIISKPYSDQGYDTLGNTIVYKSTGEAKWRIERYFAGESVYINNNGDLLTFITPFNDRFSLPVSLYKDGHFYKSYKMADLVNVDRGYAKIDWIFDYSYKGGIKDTTYIHSQGIIELASYEPDSVENMMYKWNHFNHYDSLFITTSEEKTIMLSLETGEAIHKIENAYNWFKYGKVVIDSLTILKTEMNYDKREYGDLELADSRNFNKSLADYLGFKTITTSELGTIKIKKGVRVDIYILIGLDGKAEILFIDGEKKELKEKIAKYILGSTFSTRFNTPNVEKTYFFEIIHMDRRK